MDSNQIADYESQSQSLRADLKKWENEWAKTHNGDKPSRQDIKQNLDIAQKYKQYNRIRDILAGKVDPEPAQNAANRKRKSTDAPLAQTPSKRTRTAQTPSKVQNHSEDLTTAVTPSLNRKLFSPAVPTSVGPTPQKDGRVLGLFDLLTGTPSRSAGGDGTVSIFETSSRALGTPSRKTGRHSDLPDDDKLTRTPVSSSKRSFLDGFMTPLHKRDGNAVKTPKSGSVSKLQFATPAFLRRTHAVALPAVDENGVWEVEPIRLPRKPIRRGLSAVVADLRRLEEDAMDEELEAMREMEMEMEPAGVAKESRVAEGGAAPEKVTTEAGESHPMVSRDNSAPEVVIEESQPRLLGAFDDEGLYDSPDEDQRDRGGQPLRTFKKRGQKRTTRKVNIKPTRMKRPAEPEENPIESDGDEPHGGDGDGDIVPETQLELGTTPSSDLVDLGSDFDGSDGSDDDDDLGSAKRSKAATTTAKGKESGIKKVVRKVKAAAHANFRRLKLRNHGSKGGPGYNSRFRRR